MRDAGLVEIYLTLGALAITASFLSPRAQRLGDLMAGTFVVSEPAALLRLQPRVFPTPPGHAEYVDVLDVARLGDAGYGVVREALLRLGTLDPAAHAVTNEFGNGWLIMRWCPLDDRRGIRAAPARLSAAPWGPAAVGLALTNRPTAVAGAGLFWHGAPSAARPILGWAALMGDERDAAALFDHAATTPPLPEAIEAMAR
jgi:hypothetical protein